jgi:hypothetical protein
MKHDTIVKSSIYLFDGVCMLKNIFLAGALLAPVLAYAGSPSTELSVQIVPATSPTPPPTSPTPPPSSGIACDIGPNYTGSIPAGAQAAGFTHCAANYDFTTSSNFTYNGNTYNFSNLSTWLDCAGASNPLWFHTGYVSAATPCSDISIVNDSGSNALHLVWTPTDAQNGSLTTGIQTSSSNNSQYTTFPQGVYTEITFRSDAATQTNGSGDGDLFSYVSWSFQPSPTTNGFIEWDVIEAYADGGAGACIHDWGNGGNSPGCAAGWWNSNTNFAPNQEAAYHSYGELITSDGSANLAACAFLDNVLDTTNSCVKFTPGNPSIAFVARNYFATGVGTTTNPPPVPTGNEDTFVKRIIFFSCPDWQTGQCNTSPVYAGP